MIDVPFGLDILSTFRPIFARGGSKIAKFGLNIWPLGRCSSKTKQQIWNIKQAWKHRWWFYVLPNVVWIGLLISATISWLFRPWRTGRENCWIPQFAQQLRAKVHVYQRLGPVCWALNMASDTLPTSTLILQGVKSRKFGLDFRPVLFESPEFRNGALHVKSKTTQRASMIGLCPLKIWCRSVSASLRK